MCTHCLLSFQWYHHIAGLQQASSPPGSPGSAFQLVSVQHVLVHGVIPSWGQDFAFPFFELHKFPVGSFLQPVKVPQNGTKTIWCISHCSWYCTICKLADGAVSFIIWVINEEQAGILNAASFYPLEAHCLI